MNGDWVMTGEPEQRPTSSIQKACCHFPLQPTCQLDRRMGDQMLTNPLPLDPTNLSAGSSGGSVSDAKPNASSSGASTAKVSTDKYRNSAVVAGVITAAASLGWSPTVSRKKEEVQD
ncbi:hypothetical protein ACFX13_047527 [Malus domestica]